LEQTFDELLTKTTKAFEKCELGGHGTTTYSGVKTRFERIDARQNSN